LISSRECRGFRTFCGAQLSAATGQGGRPAHVALPGFSTEGSRSPARDFRSAFRRIRKVPKIVQPPDCKLRRVDAGPVIQGRVSSGASGACLLLPGEPPLVYRSACKAQPIDESPPDKPRRGCTATGPAHGSLVGQAQVQHGQVGVAAADAGDSVCSVGEAVHRETLTPRAKTFHDPRSTLERPDPGKRHASFSGAAGRCPRPGGRALAGSVVFCGDPSGRLGQRRSESGKPPHPTKWMRGLPSDRNRHG
jgi:hypothetical protein